MLIAAEPPTAALKPLLDDSEFVAAPAPISIFNNQSLLVARTFKTGELLVKSSVETSIYDFT